MIYIRLRLIKLSLTSQPKSIDFGSRSSATIISTSVKSERPSGVASLWHDVVTRLEQSVEGELVSDDYKQVLKSIKLLRQFAVASTTNKAVVSNSEVLRPRLLELLSRFQSWSAQQLEVCLDLCGLVNSLVRECPTFSEHILSHPTILNQLLEGQVHVHMRFENWWKFLDGIPDSSCYRRSFRWDLHGFLSVNRVIDTVKVFGRLSNRFPSPIFVFIRADICFTSSHTSVILNGATCLPLREACLLMLRSLFSAENLSSVLSKVVHVPSRRQAAVSLFTDRTLGSLIDLFRTTTANTLVNYSSTPDHSGLTNNARCYLMQLLALLATDAELATRLNQLHAVEVCHQIILATVCGHYPRSSMATATAFRLGLSTRSSISVSPLACAFAVNPSNQLAARFALKLLVHLFFHVADALDTFKEAYGENDPFKLIACYGHMTNSVPPNVTGVSYQLPPGYRSKRTRKLTTTDLHASTVSTSVSVDTTSSSSDRYPLAGRENRCSTPGHMIVPVSCCAPSTHGTQVFLGLLRGLIYWRMLNQMCGQNVNAVDQFGNHVTSATGLGLTDDDIALMVIQPLTEGCLQSEDIRILSWICHVLVLVLGHRSELHLWTVYTNSFIREVDSRVSSMLHAVQGASDHHEHVQFIEHLIPLVKLFACLASSCEAVRVLFTETSMCNKLVDFALNLKSMGAEHVTLVLEFQHSIAVLLHVFSRSFGSHHSFFRQENIVHHLLQMIEDNLLPACRGHSLCADLVEAASCTLINLLTPMSPLRQASQSLIDRCTTVLIRLIKTTELPRSSTSSAESDEVNCDLPELTSDLRSSPRLAANRLQRFLVLFRLNGVWGLSNLLHSAASSVCSSLFDRLINDGAWLELVRPTHHSEHSPSIETQRRDQTGPMRRLSYESGTIVKTKSLPTYLPRARESSRVYSDSVLSKSMPPDLPGVPTANFQVVLSVSSRYPLEEQQQSSPVVSASCSTDDQVVPVQTLLVYHTLLLLRNLLRHREGILVLAHIANGQTAMELLHRNEDLIEKLKLFMRSSNSYTKAAALTATYNLLGLGRENSDSRTLLQSLRNQHEPFFLPYRQRLHHRHHRHNERRKNNPESHVTVCAITSPQLETSTRDVVTCVAQSALEEAEEELEEEQDIVFDHANVAGPSSSVLSCIPNTVLCPTSEGSSLAETTSCMEHSAVSFPAPERRHHRVYRGWQPVLGSSSVTEIVESTHPTPTDPSPDGASPVARVGHSGYSSASSSSASTSSTSCAEEDTALDTATQLSELDRITAQNLCGASSSASDLDLSANNPVTREFEQNSRTRISRAPLADQEGIDEIDLQSAQGTTTASGALTNTEALIPNSDSTVASGNVPSTSATDNCPSSCKGTSARTRCSRKDWEVGFRQVLLPFLQELQSDQILRSTWDWLMLRASTRGRPIQLHQLFAAWQRLYNTIPRFSLPQSPVEPLNLDASLFTGCANVDSFLKKLKDTLSISSTGRSQIPRPRDSRHYPRRRHHHHCHRHQLRMQSRHMEDSQSEQASAVTVDASSPTPIAPTIAAEDDTERLVGSPPSERPSSARGGQTS
ncbi:uncharacterized protein DEA37_0014794 [Paragonimus westermani]|uniref:Plant heme peroxidase family profile domain-containing protein n=1 Tax=Paragonimus westermani TaxID=34504 RepID=A0A5J4NK81_9TREM|nr:uncharacterized protein DEA37_0014794 [Paragonimus westermani]